MSVPHVDVAMIVGTLSSAPSVLELPSGSSLHRFQVTARCDERTESIPVTWLDPPRVPALNEGDTVVVVGAVRRRWFRAGGRTATATELAAQRVTKATKRTVRAAAGEVGRVLQATVGDTMPP